MVVTKAEKADAIKRLKELLRPGDTLHTAIRHVARSGMSRAINVYLLRSKGRRNVETLWLSYLVAKATGFPFSEKYEALWVDGCGMDMGFHVVYTLGRVLWPNGGSIKKSARHFSSKDKPTRESDGGYLLVHRWIG